MPVQSSTNVAQLLQLAQAEIPSLNPGECFTVRDLFQGYAWNRLPKGTRIQLGSVFFGYAQGAGAQWIAIGPKTPQNQQQYVKR